MIRCRREARGEKREDIRHITKYIIEKGEERRARRHKL